jgi:hypothetical protein
MAKIKSKGYTLDGILYNVDFYCSKEGVFSVKTYGELMEKLNINDRELQSKSLSTIENIILDAVIKYKDSRAEYNLKIGITLGASGKYKLNEDGTPNEDFNRAVNGFRIQTPYSFHSVIGFEYRVLIEENRDGNIKFYETRLVEEMPEPSTRVALGDYMLYTSTSKNNDEVIIDYSDDILGNIKSITRQFQRATSFLVKILTSGNAQTLLSGNNLKALE